MLLDHLVTYTQTKIVIIKKGHQNEGFNYRS